MGSGGGSPPPPPDPAKTAAIQGAWNQQSGIASQRGSMVNQITPYGNLVYTQTGTQNIPGTGGVPSLDLPTYTSTSSLSNPQQALLDALTGSKLQGAAAGSNLLAGANYGVEDPATAIMGTGGFNNIGNFGGGQFIPQGMPGGPVGMMGGFGGGGNVGFGGFGGGGGGVQTPTGQNMGNPALGAIQNELQNPPTPVTPPSVASGSPQAATPQTTATGSPIIPNVDWSQSPSGGPPGRFGGAQSLTDQMMGSWLQGQAPWMQINQQQLDTNLRNRGLNPTPTATNDPSTWGAYERAMGQLNQSNDMAVAQQASQFQPSAVNEALQMYQLPASLGQQLATFGSPNNLNQTYINPPGISIQAPNYEQDVMQAYQAQMQAYEQQQAQSASEMQGLFGIGGSLLSSLGGMI